MTEGTEFTRPMAIVEIGPEPLRHAITATAAECRAVAARLGLVKLTDFRTDMVLVQKNGGALSVRGEVRANIVQHCVVGGEPVEDRVEDRFEVAFGVGMKPTEADLIIDGEDDEPLEPLSGPMLDLGEIAVQHLSLSLDPYPHAPGIGFQTVESEGDLLGEDIASGSAPKANNPFAVLDKLRDRLKE